MFSSGRHLENKQSSAEALSAHRSEQVCLKAWNIQTIMAYIASPIIHACVEEISGTNVDVLRYKNLKA